MNDTRKREISTTIEEISEAERALRQQGINATEPDDWQQLRDIVDRMIMKMSVKDAAE